MTAWRLIEGVITDLTTYVATNHAAKIFVINARYADSVTLTVFNAYHVASMGLTEIQSFPVFFAVPESSSLPLSAMSLSNVAVDGTHHIRCGVAEKMTNVGSRHDTLGARMMRHAIALVELIVEAEGADALGGAIIADDEPINVQYTERMDGTDQYGQVIIDLALQLTETKA